MSESRKDTFGQGLTAGLIGYAVVFALVALGDWSLGRSPFYTVSLIGQTMFYGLRSPATMVIWPGPVFAFNGMHLMAFVVLGVAGAWLADLSERGPEMWFVGLFLFLFLLYHAFAFMLLFTEPMRGAVPMWLVLVPTVLAGVSMAAYLLWVHPRLRNELHEWREE